MQDVFTKERQAWLTGARRSAPNDKARMQAKFDAARAAMGDKYCCHPSHRVPRLDATVPTWTGRAWRPMGPLFGGRLSDNLIQARCFERPSAADFDTIRLFPHGGGEI